MAPPSNQEEDIISVKPLSRGDRLGFCYHAPFMTEW
jgi:hypothetical protein